MSEPITSEAEKILLVDDDPNVLSGYVRQLRYKFKVDTANGGAEGILKIKDSGPYAVVVSDYRMPLVDGLSFLCAARESSPDTVRIMLTGQAEMQTAIDAINKGGFFRFLIKPCSAEVLIDNVEAALRQYRLVTAEKTLLGKTLRGSIEVLTEILSMSNPVAFSRASRIEKLATGAAAQMEGTDAWEVSCSAMLSQIGFVTLTPTLQQKLMLREELTPDEKEEFKRHAGSTAQLLSKIPRLETVAEAIRWQNCRYDGLEAADDEPAGKKLPVSSRILKAVIDYDELAIQNWQPAAILDLMKSRQGVYDPVVLLSLEQELLSHGEKLKSWHLRELKVEELTAGMILAEDLHAASGLLILPKGHELSELSRMRLVNFHRVGDLKSIVKVVVPVAETE